jgi:hypothetical protein
MGWRDNQTDISMPTLRIESGPLAGQSFLLRPGKTQIGRRDDNIIQLGDASISGLHCEIVCSAGEIRIRDLGSTNGTFLDGARVQESLLQTGQTFVLGSVICRVEDEISPSVTAAASNLSSAPSRLRVPRGPMESEPVPASAPAAVLVAAASIPAPSAPASALSVAYPVPPSNDCRNHPGTAGTLVCQKCETRYCPACVKTQRAGTQSVHICLACAGFCISLSKHQSELRRRNMTFFNSIGGAFVYPWIGNGPFMLIAGTIFFGFFDLAKALPLWWYQKAAVVLGTGYLFAFLKDILTSSAHGEERMPGWPEVSNFGEVAAAAGQLALITIVCLAPGILSLVFVDSLQLSISLIILGLFYFPMAVTAVSMVDSIGGLNPLVLIPSIMKLFPQYVVACGVLLAAAAIRGGVEWGFSALKMPAIGFIVVEFVTLYLLVVEMRLLGLLYLTNKQKLAWF